MSNADVLRECFLEAIRPCLDDVEGKMLDVLTSAAPKDTGAVRDSIKVNRVGEFEWRATTPSDVAAIQNFGSGPYKIRPKSKKALFWDGALHPVAEVNHPGVSKHKGWWDNAFEGVDLFDNC